MFDLPSSKRVKRSEILNSNDEDCHEISTIGRNSDLQAVTDYGFEYDFVEAQKSGHAAQSQQNEDNTEAFAFNLFRPAAKQLHLSSLQASRDDDQRPLKKPQDVPNIISIRSPSPPPALETDIEKAHFVKQRPDSYYFTGIISASIRDSYKAAAITSADIQARASRAWPGTHSPWRVLALPAHGKQQVVHRILGCLHSTKILVPMGTLFSTGNDEKRGRARPSKKRRDLLKAKAASRQKLIDETKSKEEHEREKKSRLNRQRKLKRRAKERREKEQAKAEIGGEDEKNVAGTNSEGRRGNVSEDE